MLGVSRPVLFSLQICLIGGGRHSGLSCNAMWVGREGGGGVVGGCWGWVGGAMGGRTSHFFEQLKQVVF